MNERIASFPAIYDTLWTNEPTTNERRRRTTWTNIIPRQDSQNPRANKTIKIYKNMSVFVGLYFSVFVVLTVIL